MNSSCLGLAKFSAAPAHLSPWGICWAPSGVLLLPAAFTLAPGSKLGKSHHSFTCFIAISGCCSRSCYPLSKIHLVFLFSLFCKLSVCFCRTCGMGALVPWAGIKSVPHAILHHQENPWNFIFNQSNSLRSWIVPIVITTTEKHFLSTSPYPRFLIPRDCRF